MTNQTFNIPMNGNFLPQAQCIQMLISNIQDLLPTIENAQVRNVLVCSLSVFTHERTVCSLSIIDLMNKAREMNIELTTKQAMKMLEEAVADVRDNYASQAIEYHLDRYQEELERNNAK